MTRLITARARSGLPPLPSPVPDPRLRAVSRRASVAASARRRTTVASDTPSVSCRRCALLSAEQARITSQSAAARSRRSAFSRASQGARSASVSGFPARIFATLDGGWRRTRRRVVVAVEAGARFRQPRSEDRVAERQYLGPTHDDPTSAGDDLH